MGNTAAFSNQPTTQFYRNKENGYPNHKNLLGLYSFHLVMLSIFQKSSSRNALSVLEKIPNVQIANILSPPLLSKQHKKLRVDFAKKEINMCSELESIIISGEEIFKLDRPDDFRYFMLILDTLCNDLCKNKNILPKRKFSGCFVMVWAGFAAKGMTHIALIQVIKSYKEIYIDILCCCQPSNRGITYKFREDYFFQQDNMCPYTFEGMLNHGLKQTLLNCLTAYKQSISQSDGKYVLHSGPKNIF